jgi:hypothetical protein
MPNFCSPIENVIDDICYDITDDEMMSDDDITYNSNDTLSYDDIYHNTQQFHNNQHFYNLTTKDYETFGSSADSYGLYYNIFNSCNENTDDHEIDDEDSDAEVNKLTYMDFVHNTHMFHIMNNWLIGKKIFSGKKRQRQLEDDISFITKRIRLI